MLKKSLLSLAVSASLVGLTGCNISSTTDNQGTIDQAPVETGSPEYIAENADKISTTFPLFNPSKILATGLPEIPVTSDLLFKGTPDADGYIDKDESGDYNFGDAPTADGTIPLDLGDAPITDTANYNPIFNAAADLDGFSTTAQIDIPFNKGIDPTTATAATVFVIPLDYGTGEDPLTSTATPTPGAPAAIEVSVITFAADGEDAVSGQGDVLRISPTTPLDPATRYIIVVTNGIKGLDGLPVVQAPTYSLLSSSADIFTAQDDGTKAKAALQKAIQGYEAAAEGVWNSVGASYTADNIVYAFSFTTGGTTTVLNSMAAPANFVSAAISPTVGAAFNVTLPASLRNEVEKVVAPLREADGTLSTANNTTAVGTLMAGALNPILSATWGDDPAAQQAGVGGIVAIHNSIPSPAPRITEFTGTDTEATAVDYDTVMTPLVGPGASGGTGRIANGSIKVPYYGGIVDTTNTTTTGASAGLVMTHWTADDELDTKLGAVLAGAQITDTSVVEPPSSNVTRLFPVPKPTGYVDAPVSIIYSTACNSAYKPVVFVHGITSNRTASFGVAGQLFAADPCYATVAMDLPLHGPTEEDDGSFLALVGETDGDQRHFGVTIDAATLQPTLMAVNAADSDASGSMYINLLSFQATRDNVRQSVMDLLNLNASLEFMDFTDEQVGVDFDVSNIHVVGHSLGAILAVNAVAISNSLGADVYDPTTCPTCNPVLPKVSTVTLANGGGQLVKLFENSNIGTGLIIPGLAALGTQAGLDLSQGSSLYELTLNVFQATVDSADPINFASTLKATNTPVLAFEIAGDSVNDPDATVPVDAVENRIAPALPAPLAGTEPLATELELAATDADVADDDTAKQLLVRFSDGEHSSFAGADAASGNGVFAEMMVQLGSFLNSNGEALDVSDDTVIVSAQ